jgi:hypothetical protein
MEPAQAVFANKLNYFFASGNINFQQLSTKEKIWLLIKSKYICLCKKIKKSTSQHLHAHDLYVFYNYNM